VRGEGVAAYNRMYFLVILLVDGPIPGGLYKQQFTVCLYTKVGFDGFCLLK